MAYAADKKPGELTALTALATDDLFVVGDTSDASEVAKSITKANLEADLTPALADTVTTNANLTGHVTSTGNAAILGSFTVAQLNTAVSDATLQQTPAEGAFVDGDKTKLDGIETAADVTDTTNVTAAGALMDSECTSLADVKALDQSVVSGAAPTFVGTNFSGTAASLTVGATTGVEAGADVTDTANVTAAGALMDSELTDIAAVKATADASIADVNTGTDTAKFVTPDALQGSKRNIRWLTFNLVEAATDCAAATNIGGDFVSPIAGVIQQSDTTPFYLYATNSTAGTTGTMVVDISIGGTSIMTTNKLDFDTGEKTTTTAATPPDLTTTALAVGDIITIDIDSVHTTAAKGLTVYMAVLES